MLARRRHERCHEKNGISAHPSRQLCYQAISGSLTRERGQWRLVARAAPLRAACLTTPTGPRVLRSPDPLALGHQAGSMADNGIDPIAGALAVHEFRTPFVFVFPLRCLELNPE